ncbi:hypothetical protein AGOR_G00001930 [Albula goreensis]|uniref:Phospholipid-transporting ATPase n=1 Tax=Albula goreensis TaxID=1534307 RepID=A0A8T3E7T2_9TELE|nr:hypothetical protein AGOR_G00001930 [Albula goreensis]
MNIRVGDVIKLENNQSVAADVLLLSSSEPYGLSYIETAELDGETNLKVRQALSVTSELGADISRLAEFDGKVICEAPNNKLDHFVGTLCWKENKYSLDNQNLLLRGCVLRNTEWCYGLVIFAGPVWRQTKLMQNCGPTKFKQTSIKRLLNTLILRIFVVLACMGLILAMGSGVWEENVGQHFSAYLQRDEGQNVASGFHAFWSYIIILSTVVPISLCASMELLCLGHSCFINWDRDMYYSPRDTPAQARTTNLNEELGQVQYVFSDKTGTLTRNVMTFSKCSIDGIIYGVVKDKFGHKVEITEGTPCVDFSFNPLWDGKFRFYDGSLLAAVRDNDPAVQQFLRLLALCHTVMPEEKTHGEVVYQAQSPDEGALVTAAQSFGFVFRARTPETITLYELGQPITYQLLAILDFNNERKRMSVIVRTPEGSLRLYCKGADTVMFDRLGKSNGQLMRTTSEHLNDFASEGLRTLALAFKDLEDDVFEEWMKRLVFAKAVPEGRQERLKELYEEIEQDMTLIGATAVEDKLQDYVPETISCLSQANIKIWVLTGDKLETAMNIGYSCGMLGGDMKEVFVVNGDTALGVQQQLRSAKEQILGLCGETTHDGLADAQNRQTDGETQCLRRAALQKELWVGFKVCRNSCVAPQVLVLEGGLGRMLLDVAGLCQSVMCCRVTPLQKAQVVQLVKRGLGAVTLAIGDGANDVSMIKIHLVVRFHTDLCLQEELQSRQWCGTYRVGISGQEGMQAVLASDFSLAQFHYLWRLLLVHGRWSYIRTCNFLYYCFYKNFAFTFVHLWFAFFCGFSAQTVYDEWFIMLYNAVYTCMPVLAMGLFNQDVSKQQVLNQPKLYLQGQENLLFNKRIFTLCWMHGIYSSLALFFIPYAAFQRAVRDDGKDISDLQTFAVTVATSLVVVVSIQIGLDTNYWTVVNHICTWGSLFVYFSIVFVMDSDGIFRISPSQFPYIGTAGSCLSQRSVWLVIFLTAVVCVVPVVTIRFLRTEFCPTLTNKVRRQQKASRGQYLGMQRHMHLTSLRRSAYAFSHQEGYGELITSGRNTKTSSHSTTIPPATTSSKDAG